MSIQEMHQSFRVFAQQMGMQLVRAILPEEIDVYLNSAINERVREVILSNTDTDSTGKLIVNNNATPINYVRTLYRKYEVNNNSHFDTEFSLINLDALHFVSFEVVYDNNKTYGCRFIEPDRIQDTIRDYCSAPSKEYPIVTLYTRPDGDLIVKIYNDNAAVHKLNVGYIKLPNKVSYKNNVDCDLPEYTHNDIIQLACQKYFISVGSTTHNVNN